MVRFANGHIPLKELVTVGPEQYLTPGTAARWAAMVADGKRQHGVTLRISKGENGYRSYAGQVVARKYWADRGKPGNAAYPGTSSHGGVFRGRDAMAIDVGNWAVIGQAKFYALARKHGFEPGFFDWEPWHLIDWNPWTTPTPAGGGNISKPSPVIVPDDVMEAIRMAQIRYVHRVEPDYATEWMIVGLEIPGGYQVTTDRTRAEGWGAVYGTDKGGSWKALNRKQYVALQASARELHEKWVAMQKTIHKG